MTDAALTTAATLNSAADSQVPPRRHVTTTGDDLTNLTFKGTLLTIVTLGIYRFWFKTNLRRWYWRNTQIGGHALEYRGTGKELFIGFLMAIAILSPLYLIGYLVSFIPNIGARIAVSLTLGVIYLLIAQYGVFRGRRYRLTRTLWRGLRFDLTGSAWSYAFKSFGWLLLTVLTLGLTLPLARRSMEGMKIRATRFGSAEGAFDVSAVPLIKRWIVIWLAVVLVFVGGAFLAAGAVRSAITQTNALSALLILLRFLPMMLLLAFLTFILLWPWYKTAEFRAFTNGARIGPVTFTSHLPTGRVYLIHIKFYAALLGIAVAVGLLAYAVARTPRGGGISLMHIFVIAAYFAVIILFAVLKEVMVNQQIWRLSAATLDVHDLAAADDVIGGAVAIDSATGEGFADAIDFGGV